LELEPAGAGRVPRTGWNWNRLEPAGTGTGTGWNRNRLEPAGIKINTLGHHVKNILVEHKLWRSRRHFFSNFLVFVLGNLQKMPFLA